jgi:hypothetical protein
MGHVVPGVWWGVVAGTVPAAVYPLNQEHTPDLPGRVRLCPYRQRALAAVGQLAVSTLPYKTSLRCCWGWPLKSAGRLDGWKNHLHVESTH